LQAAVRDENIDEVRAEEKAEKQAQKRKETAQKKAEKGLIVRVKTPVKPRKALVKKKKEVRFINRDIRGVVADTSVK
jgi:hypothetical protein